MSQKAALRRDPPSTSSSDVPEAIPEPGRKRKFSATPGRGILPNAGPEGSDSIYPSGFDQATFHNYPEVDKIATNVYADLPLPGCDRSIPNFRGQLRLWRVSQNIYRSTPNGIHVKFADGSTQWQFPGRLYSSDVCGLSRRARIPPEKFIKYSTHKQVTTALFRTAICYPEYKQFPLDYYHSSPPSRDFHFGRKTLIVRCAATASLGGIYFGPDSQYNKFNIDLTECKDDTLLSAELEVTKQAIKLATEITLTLSKGSNILPYTKIILMTSSERVVRGMTEFITHWRRMAWRGLDMVFFPKVEANKRRWEMLDTTIWKALEYGLEVDLWLVSQEAVGDAIDLVENPKENVGKPLEMDESGLMEGMEGLEVVVVEG